ncbi:MAG: ATP-binding protein [Pirellulaceae bacterium]|jgi:signal transduction histidine kinase|nr:ATP-binding protein [Pirellulaceae bacterium]
MSYRSIKPFIGETSLERKCRFLFVACLTVLLTVTFWWVEHIAEDLVQGTAIRKSRDLVDAALLRYHWEQWEASDPNADPRHAKALRAITRELARDLQTQKYDWDILALEETPGTELPNSEEEKDDSSRVISMVSNMELPNSEEEKEIMLQLKEALQAQMQTRSHQADVDAAGGGSPLVADGVEPRPTTTTSSPEILPVYRFLPLPSEQLIHYYQPVYWKESCTRCHLGFEGVDAFTQADRPLDQGQLPFRVVKVIIPDLETQDAIRWNRALLAAIGILTVFLAMVILYVIIRYVVVKPLKHLRDVSEEISRGNTELRAEITTNDEFEELASAFNRMLRHLTDAQDELRQVNADLDAKVDQLAQLNMQLYEMNRLKSDFLANMSHELRTPLNSIIGFSEILAGIDSLSDKQKRYAHNIRKSGRLLLDLINDILDLAKIEAGKMDVRLTEFRIGAVITAQCEMIRALSEEKNIDLICEVEPELPVMFQDQSKIQQVLINLLSNAIKFTPEGGRITVSVRRSPDDRLLLAVADTGVGIPEEDREIIFEKFRQSSQTVGDRNLTREYSGTGLGLSIVKELCKLLGGEISFVSELGRGSTFTVAVPWVLVHPGFRQSAIDAQLDEIVESQRLASQLPGIPHLAPVAAGTP